MAPVGRIFKAFLHTARTRRLTRIPSFEKTYDGRKPIPNEPERQAPAHVDEGPKIFLTERKEAPPKRSPRHVSHPARSRRVVDAPDIPIQRQAASAASSPMSRKSDIFPPATVTSRAGPPRAPWSITRNPLDKSFSGPFCPNIGRTPHGCPIVVFWKRGENSGDRNRGDSGLRPLLSSKGPAPFVPGMSVGPTKVFPWPGKNEDVALTINRL
jgi:hypothetical protein